jgi:hypothetical protein
MNPTADRVRSHCLPSGASRKIAGAARIGQTKVLMIDYENHSAARTRVAPLNALPTADRPDSLIEGRSSTSVTITMMHEASNGVDRQMQSGNTAAPKNGEGNQ